MTTVYSSKKTAVAIGIFYARGKVDIPFESLKFEKAEVGHPLDVEGKFKIEGEKVKIKNKNGEDVEIVVTPCNGGFHLWLCSSDFCLRT